MTHTLKRAPLQAVRELINDDTPIAHCDKLGVSLKEDKVSLTIVEDDTLARELGFFSCDTVLEV